jgi:aryl carrier-like protein
VVPSFMVPSWFVTVDGLPRTVTGKLDRRQLPALDEADLPRLSGDTGGEPGTDGDGALSQAEERLVQIWKQVLQVETVTVDDDFFSLGGDSLRILRVLAEAEASGLGLSLVQLFEHTTIRELAAALPQPATSSQGVPSSWTSGAP